MQLKQGTLLQGGKYRIEQVLGQGGFGITYLATQDILDRKVAIKEFFMKELCERDESTSYVTLGTQGSKGTVSRFREKFVKEARNIAKLNHPHIVRVIDIFEENGTAYYVMEYAVNGSLADKVKREGYLTEPLATCYIKQVADALDYIHARSMNHLDVKPGNIMLNEKDEAVLIDFGLSKQYDSSTGNQTSTTPVGISEGYAPMEQYKQGGVGEFSPETDIYALGATFFKLLTGITPPSASDVYEDGLPINELKNRGVSQSTIEIICKAMEGRKKTRMKSTNTFIEGLKNNFSSKQAQEYIDSEKTQTNDDDFEIDEVTSFYENNVTADSSEPVEQDSPNYINEEDSIWYKNKWLWIVLGIIIFSGVYYFSLKGSENPIELYNKGKECYNDTNYVEAVSFYKKAAELGYVEAQGALGDCFFLGEGITQDNSQAVYWHQKAAEQGYADSQYSMGYFYEYGCGVPQDYSLATTWYHKAAEQGHADAQCALGVCYDNGQGVTMDDSIAVLWYQLAADQGNVLAQYNLGCCYANAQGISQDYSQAVYWYRKAADQGDASAQCNLGYSYENAQGISQDYSQAVYWYRKAADQGNPYAQYNLALCYYNGKGVKIDKKQAKSLLEEAAKWGDDDAKKLLREWSF